MPQPADTRAPLRRLALALALLLSGCGQMGPLQPRPAVPADETAQA